MVPCVLHEDEHLLVVNKPAGWNTHAPSPFANEGIYEWLRSREPRWARLAIIHRLDKETSGILLFAKSVEANRSLTVQFAGRAVRKRYLLLTDRPIPAHPVLVRSPLMRLGQRYGSVSQKDAGEMAETRFRPPTAGELAGLRIPPSKMPLKVLMAEPVTGRTHQIRAHAAERGFPILGDALYGGSQADRVYLHALGITISHPASTGKVTFEALPEFPDPAAGLRDGIIDGQETNACRLIHGAGDGSPGCYVDRLGDFLLAQSEESPTAGQLQRIEAFRPGTQAVYHKERQVRRATAPQSSPQRLQGEEAPATFSVLENGLRFELSFAEGYSVGLFLDQRDNRRRLLTGHIAPEFDLPPGFTLLNCFAYTCGFSVAAAAGGAATTSLDLSKKYLDWGRRNFGLNGIESSGHGFIFGDVFDWLKRLGRKGRLFDVIVLDPPTFSQSRVSGVFRAERDYGKVVRAALPLLARGGVLFCSSNAAGWAPASFLETIRRAATEAGRPPTQEHYAPQPPDFPITRGEPAHLRTAWFRMSGHRPDLKNER